jgi:uncharacterized membrane protein YcgQ (UPF0703/DUF1980 family)
MKTVVLLIAIAAIVCGCKGRNKAASGVDADRTDVSAIEPASGFDASGFNADNVEAEGFETSVYDTGVFEASAVKAGEIKKVETKTDKKKPASEAASLPTLEIREKMFIAQTNDVYLNPEDYMGRRIKLEGLFKTDKYTGSDKDYCFVIRYGPGCCGYDGTAGFEVSWTGGRADKAADAYPSDDEWVEAVGVLDSYDEDGYPYIYLALESLTVKDERGKETVAQ